jgi:hypothetical protein
VHQLQKQQRGSNNPFQHQVGIINREKSIIQAFFNLHNALQTKTSKPAWLEINPRQQEYEVKQESRTSEKPNCIPARQSRDN